MSREFRNNRDFFHDVYDVVRLIPLGKVSTYGAIARYLGVAKSARLVGWAMRASHHLRDVPAHRVLNRNGMLTGKHHFASPFEMQHLLESEGILVVDDQVQDFSNVFWDPSGALKLP
jgi:methylated-DNA-protein-cysteine methyltransferase-like protein